MKKSIIYILILGLTGAFFSCNDSIEDAVEKHVYGEDENPYLRTDAEAVISMDMDFAVGHLEAHIIQLADYAEVFQKEMNMSVDQVISGLENGTVVFYNISTSRGSWDKSAMTKGTTGWYYNSAGGICEAGDATQTASVDIDKNAKTLAVNVNEKVMAGTVVAFNVGFAVNGPDYDKYVRFLFNISVTDPSIILATIHIPDGDYNSYGIDFNQYASTIQTCMQMTVSEFLANMNTAGGKIKMYMVNKDSGVWDETSSYTANAPGYWINNLGAVCNWNAAGFSLYAETNAADEILYIGRAPALAAGTTFTISVGYKDTSNEKNFFRFILTVILD